MQNAAFSELDLDWSYEAIEVEPDRFDGVVQELGERGFVGANVTVPHKLRALAAARTQTDVARAVGAANTLSFEPEGVVAHNTDVEGFLGALRERIEGAPEGMRALVLGAGGAARAVAYALASHGASQVEVWNRHPERALDLVEELQEHVGGGRLRAVAEPATEGRDLLVNATSVGMEAANAASNGAEGFKLLHISADNLTEVQVVADLVYRDGGTALLREAETRGLTLVDGIDILVHQGAASFELWTGRKAPIEVMRLAARTRQADPRA
jgi:shikimate dehydrogenase